MTRFKHGMLWLILILSALATGPLQAYHFFQNTSFQPYRWQTLPVIYQVDNGPTNIQAELQQAAATWNNVPTAVDLLSMVPAMIGPDPVDFTVANFETAWGIMNGDGHQEVVFDEDGSIIRDILGRDPAQLNGYGPSHQVTVSGTAVIDDAYLIINGSRANFDRQSTEVHEIGHTLGLAHSSVGMFNSDSAPSDALEVVAIGDVPTMHPYSTGTGTARRTLEADDRAGISELYPDSGYSSLGVIAGKVTRCGSSPAAALSGVNVRAVKIGDRSVQVSRYTAFDGNTDGRYRIAGLPPGTYHIVVEPMGVNDFTEAMAIRSRIDRGFATEHASETECPEELPDTPRNVAAGASGSESVDVEVGGVRLALVVDDTGSMGEEIAGVRQILQNLIEILRHIPFVDFPETALYTFKDDVTLRLVSDDPDRLQAAIAALEATGGDDCPESSNAALLAAGRVLQPLGVALLFTDADSRANGPGRAAVLKEYRSRGILLSTLLSGSCTTPLGDSVPFFAPSSNTPAHAWKDAGSGEGQFCETRGPSRSGDEAADEIPLPETLGAESALETFPSLAASTGGFFFRSTSDLRFVNTGTNIALASVIPAVGLVVPDQASRGTTLNLEVLGGQTNFKSTSILTFSVPGIFVNSVSVKSPTRMIANVTITPGTSLGLTDLTVTTHLGGDVTESATGRSALEIMGESTAPRITSLVPSQGRLGQTFRATLTVANASLGASPSVDLGDGISVSNVIVVASDSLAFDLQIDSEATPGPRDAVLETPAGSIDLPEGFLVIDAAEAVPLLSSLTPAQGHQAQILNLEIIGVNTNFAAGVSVVDFGGAGITVLSTIVVSPTQITAQISISPDATPGFRNVSVTTGGEVAAALDAFEVTTQGAGAAEIPTLSDLGLIATVALLAAASLFQLRRRRST